jgi:glycosyltransferase involved in cell wall biosynthesis
MTSKKNILIIANSHLNKDPRILRQVSALENEYHIYTIGFSPVKNDISNLVDLYKQNNIIFKLLRLFFSFTYQFNAYSKIVLNQYKLNEKIKEIKFDLILCNDVDTLPLGFKISENKVPIWVDLHEYSPKEFENNILWRLYYQPYKTWLCSTYLPKVNHISVVCEGIAKEYENNFKITTHTIITNATFFNSELTPSLPKQKIQIIHHGAAMPNRKIESMIEMMHYLDNNYELYLMLVVTGSVQHEYISSLKSRALEISKNIFFLDAVPTNQIAATINKYDIGLYILEASGFNELYALPNKFFEFIQARLCIAVSPNPEMASIVKKSKLGIVSNDHHPENMAKAIAVLSKDEIFEYKSNAHKEAWEYSAEKNLQLMQHIAKSVIEKFNY